MKTRVFLAIVLLIVLLTGMICPVHAASAADSLVNTKKLPAGDSMSDWYAFLQGRTGQWSQGEDYLGKLQSYVNTQYQKNGGLDDSDAFEWHRIALTVAALGGDPTCFGMTKKKEPIDMIAQGTYDWMVTNSLSSQGNQGLIYGLIALDAQCYAVPQRAKYDRNTMVQELLFAQQPDGGFPLANGSSDVAMTAMALQALAPYRNSSVAFSRNDGTVRLVADAIDAGLAFLSRQQNEQGYFASSAGAYCESSAEVIIALCSLGLHPNTDQRFRKDGGSAVDGLLRFRLDDGTFCHSLEETEGDFLVTIKAELALAALERLEHGQRRLYDLRPEPDEAQWEQIQLVNEAIQNEVPCRALVQQYLQIPAADRSYVVGWDTAVLEEDPAQAYNLIQPGTEYVSYKSGGTSPVWFFVIAAATVIVMVLLFFRRRGSRR